MIGMIMEGMINLLVPTKKNILTGRIIATRTNNSCTLDKHRPQTVMIMIPAQAIRIGAAERYSEELLYMSARSRDLPAAISLMESKIEPPIAKCLANRMRPIVEIATPYL